MNLLPLKHRMLMTNAGNIRLRYLVIVVVCAVGFFMFSGDDKKESDVVAVRMPGDVQRSDTGLQLIKIAKEKDNLSYDPEEPGHGLSPFLQRIGARPIFSDPYEWVSTIQVQSGDTLGVLMERTGLKGEDYFSAMKAIKRHIDPQDIRPDHSIFITNTRHKDNNTVNKIEYKIDSLSSIILTQGEQNWSAEKKELPVEIKSYAVRTTIKNSIYGSLGEQNVPDGIINRMIKAYSWTVDFQRDIWGEEIVELLYETKESDDGEYVRSHRLLYANLKLRNKEIPIYLYEKEKGFSNYFEPDGQSIRRALMRTPVDGARLSSGYGMRKHPVLGYNKMHKGLDFAAPTGTPIYAAGDGVVERANRYGAYGNYIRIRHNETYKTAYAHLHKFAKKMGKGRRVKQGEVIGYVGNTGRSTGPHLHYEVIKNGRQVNPHSVDLPLGEKLKSKQMTAFKKVRDQRMSDFDRLLKVPSS